MIPFNETKEWYEQDGADHWFEIPLNTDEIKEQTGMEISGRVFTTRMPQNLDSQEGDFDGEIPVGATNKKLFMQKVKTNQLRKVFVLVEDEEFAKGNSKKLIEFYEGLGLEVFHTPVADYNTPSFETENSNIEKLDCALRLGQSCLIHCWGGSGRTGTVLIGAVQNLGLTNAIKHCRKVKSVYLDIQEQEQFLEKQHIVVTEAMAEKSPELVQKLVGAHFSKLCSQLSSKWEPAKGEIPANEEAALRMVFRVADLHGLEDFVSVSALSNFLCKIGDECSTEGLASVFGKLDASFSHHHSGYDCISFDLFRKAVYTNVIESGAEEALTKKETGH